MMETAFVPVKVERIGQGKNQACDKNRDLETKMMQFRYAVRP